MLSDIDAAGISQQVAPPLQPVTMAPGCYYSVYQYPAGYTSAVAYQSVASQPSAKPRPRGRPKGSRNKKNKIIHPYYHGGTPYSYPSTVPVGTCRPVVKPVPQQPVNYKFAESSNATFVFSGSRNDTSAPSKQLLTTPPVDPEQERSPSAETISFDLEEDCELIKQGQKVTSKKDTVLSLALPPKKRKRVAEEDFTMGSKRQR